jgi:hypothetical protein
MVHGGQQETEVFDDVIIATGFLSAPYPPGVRGARPVPGRDPPRRSM